MPRSFISNAVDALYKDALQGVMHDLGQKAIFVIVFPANKGQCSNCIYNPVNKVGSGVYNNTGPKPFTGKVCPVCENAGTVETIKRRKIPDATVAYSRLHNADANTPMMPGQLPFGYARVKVFVRYFPLLLQAEYFLVDGIRYKMVGEPKKRGLKSYVVAEVVVKRDD